MTGRLSIRTLLSTLPGKRRLMGARSCSHYVDSKELKAEFVRNDRQKKRNVRSIISSVPTKTNKSININPITS